MWYAISVMANLCGVIHSYSEFTDIGQCDHLLPEERLTVLSNKSIAFTLLHSESHNVLMAKAKKRSKLPKIVSCKLSERQYDLLKLYARQFYISRKLTQPSVSMLVRRIISNFLTKGEEGMEDTLVNSPEF